MLPPGIGLVGLYIVFMYRAQGCSLAQIRGGGGGGAVPPEQVPGCNSSVNFGDN